MKLKAFNTLLLCLCCTAVFAQYRLNGKIISSKDNAAIAGCVVYLNDNKSSVTTNARGEFAFENIKEGNYLLLVKYPSHKQTELPVTINSSTQALTITLAHSENELQEVVIKDKKTDFGFSHLQGVENMAIYEGKKTEIIMPDQLVANLASNNARQIYSRVAGLNIYENNSSGLQLNVGGRGLNPNRSSNFNIRQNGYDISADALGYPESYYTPPAEAVEQIQIVRGAASLQYGTQFGGLINFVIKKPINYKPFELTVRQTIGSNNFNSTFVSASGTVNKFSYYVYGQHKQGNGWRANTQFDSYTVYGNVNYKFNNKTKLGIDFTHLDYLAQQPGGLTDDMFKTNARQSNRERNWFKVNWNLYALHFDHKFNANNEFNLRVFGLSAYRFSLGFRPNRVATVDDNSERDLIKGHFDNWGTEARYLKRYNLSSVSSTLLLGGRYYHGRNHSTQGNGSTGKNADFNFVDPENFTANDYVYPNRNTALFLENIFRFSNKLSLTPGLRYENIDTRAGGFYAVITRDLAGNIISNSRTNESTKSKRDFLLAGVGVSYRPVSSVNVYANISQNYRSITFTDSRTANPSFAIDPALGDEKGYSLDLGVRSEQTTFYSYDISAFYLNYNNRIGEVQEYNSLNQVINKRTNIGQAIIMGIESYVEADVFHLIYPENKNWSTVLFSNVAIIQSKYDKSLIPGVQGNQVEFVPNLNLKTGLRVGYKNLKASFQYSHLSKQFTDATNAIDGGVSAVIGQIPVYSVMDLSMSYQFKRFKLEGSANNLFNQIYFTQKATGYPGPGIIPADNRAFYLTLQVRI